MVKFTVCKYNPRVLGKPKTFVKLDSFLLPDNFKDCVDSINMHRAIMLQEAGRIIGQDFKFYFQDNDNNYLIFIVA